MLHVNLRVDHSLNKAHTLRGSFQQNDNDLRNLGVGSFDSQELGVSEFSRDSNVMALLKCIRCKAACEHCQHRQGGN